jgi:large subunit ribosomal protein L24
MPAGRTALQMTLSSRGRTAAALSGALSGSGAVSVSDAQLAELDPRAFETAIAASDAGQLRTEPMLRDLVAAVLAKAPLRVAALQVPFSIRDGSLRVAATALEADGARVIASGGYDLGADQLDIRAALIATRIGTETSRPEIQLFAHGPPDRLARSLDVALLSSWLAVRSLDRETRRLDALERGEAPPPALPAQPVAIPPAAETAPDSPPLTSSVPVPGRDPRQARPRPRPPVQRASPQASAPQVLAPQASAPQAFGLDWSRADVIVPPLPPPIEVRPAPAPRPRVRAPMVLTPPAQN